MFIIEYLGSIDLFYLSLKVIREKNLLSLSEADDTRTVNKILGIVCIVSP